VSKHRVMKHWRRNGSSVQCIRNYYWSQRKGGQLQAHFNSHICRELEISLQNVVATRRKPALNTTRNWTKKCAIMYNIRILLGVLNILTLILLMWRIRWASNNARKWQMGFNSAFKGLKYISFHSVRFVHFIKSNNIGKKKGQVIPLQGRCGPEGG